MIGVQVLTLLFGLSLFLYGMTCTESALKLLAGARIRHAIDVITRNRFAGLIVGLLVTIATQSSSATTVMLVGFATAGLLSVIQAIPVVLGSAVGTTLTIQLFAWHLTDAGPLFVAGGFFLSLLARKPAWINSGRLALGFGFIFYGMTLMSDSVMPLRESAAFHSLLRLTDSPVLLLLLSTAFTAVIQSSAATVALVIGLAMYTPDAAPLLSLQKAVPLLLGADIGTCATALLASIGSGTPGRRIAWAHLFYKVTLAAVAFPCIPLLARVGAWSGAGSPARAIANIYTLCNTLGALLFLPVSAWLARLSGLLVPDRPPPGHGYAVSFIDRDFRTIPYLALAQARKEAVRMSGVVTGMFDAAWEALTSRDLPKLHNARAADDKVDFLQESISRYLTALSEREIRTQEAFRQVSLLTAVSELELIGDVISKDLCDCLTQLMERDLRFSAEGLHEAHLLYQRVRLVLYKACEALATGNTALAAEVAAEKPAIDAMHDDLRLKHFARLTQGMAETARTTTIHLDVLDDLRSVDSHCVRLCLGLLPPGPPAPAGPAQGSEAHLGPS